MPRVARRLSLVEVDVDDRIGLWAGNVGITITLPFLDVIQGSGSAFPGVQVSFSILCVISHALQAACGYSNKGRRTTRIRTCIRCRVFSPSPGPVFMCREKDTASGFNLQTRMMDLKQLGRGDA